jgi:hypothetical protein
MIEFSLLCHAINRKTIVVEIWFRLVIQLIYQDIPLHEHWTLNN